MSTNQMSETPDKPDLTTPTDATYNLELNESLNFANEPSDSKNFGSSTTLYTMMSLISDYLPAEPAEPIKFAEKPNESSPWVQSAVSGLRNVEKLNVMPTFTNATASDFNKGLKSSVIPLTPVTPLSSYDLPSLSQILPRTQIADSESMNLTPSVTTEPTAISIRSPQPFVQTFYALLGQVDGLDLQTLDMSNHTLESNEPLPQNAFVPLNALPIIQKDIESVPGLLRTISPLSESQRVQIGPETTGTALEPISTPSLVSTKPSYQSLSSVNTQTTHLQSTPQTLSMQTHLAVQTPTQAPTQHLSVSELPTTKMSTSQTTADLHQVISSHPHAAQLLSTASSTFRIDPKNSTKGDSLHPIQSSSIITSNSDLTKVPSGQLTNIHGEILAQSELETLLQMEEAFSDNLIRLEDMRQAELKIQKQAEKHNVGPLVIGTPYDPVVPVIKGAFVKENEIYVQITINGKDLIFDLGDISIFNNPKELASLEQALVAQLQSEYDPEGLWSQADVANLLAEIQKDVAQLAPSNSKEQTFTNTPVLASPILLSV